MTDDVAAGPTAREVDMDNAQVRMQDAQLDAEFARFGVTGLKADCDAAEDDGARVDETTAAAQPEPKVETKDWRWLLWDSDLARDQIHTELGAAWTAVLKEACCVRKFRRVRVAK